MALAARATGQVVGPPGPLGVEFVFHNPGRGDLSNLVKGLEDGLVAGGVLADDRYVTCLRARIERFPGAVGVRVSIRALEEDP